VRRAGHVLIRLDESEPLDRSASKATGARVDASDRYTYSARMQKKLTITIDEEVYEGLHQVIGRRRISGFIEALVRPHVISAELAQAYRAMAADEVREAEAAEWTESTIADVGDEAR